MSILLAVGINFRHLDKREISASERFLLERLITLLLANLLSNLSSFYLAILLELPLSCFSSISGVFPALLIIIPPLGRNKITNRRFILVSLKRTTSSNKTATLNHCKRGIKILKVWTFRIAKCIKIIFEFEKRKMNMLNITPENVHKIKQFLTIFLQQQITARSVQSIYSILPFFLKFFLWLSKTQYFLCC